MLISPPFLPAPGSEDEDQWIDSAMPAGLAGAGAFPVSYRLEWHGGLHLSAPMRDRVGLPLCAIADGTVVYVRQRRNADELGGPLNYAGGYTSDAVVVIRHDTEIGADAQQQPVSVRFYSVYMHLHSIRPAVIQGRRIYRKDEIGQAGHIYGTPNVFHFEICCDDANLAKLVGRAAGPLSTAADGRTDVLFGELYFHLPAGTPVYPSQPLPQFAAATAPHGRLQSICTTSEELVVGLHYAAGDATVTTYHLDGRAEQNFILEPGAEYALYETANAITACHPASARPAPSAVYELLRLGRVLGPDALDPATVPYWRQVSYPGGVGWVNLNAENVRKFSDADFPHWRGWQLIDDDANGDSRCDSAHLRQVIYDGGTSTLVPTRQHAFEQLNGHAVRTKMRRVIAKFPSEWDASTIERRWSWLKTADPENPEPFTDAEFADFCSHARALCFDLPELFQAQWSFDPREFIRHFRRCHWLSGKEVAQCIPRQCPLGTTDWAVALARGEAHRARLSRMFQKYGATTAARKVHFLSQIYIETGLFRTMVEGGRGEPDPKIPKAQYYGAFYGRGYMQLTWALNYAGYGVYRGFEQANGAYADPRITQTSQHVWSDFNPNTQKPTIRRWAPRFDPDCLVNDEHSCADSGGFFWISKPYRGTSDITRVADLGLNANVVGYVSWLVNGGANGYAERQSFARYVQNILADEPRRNGVQRWTFPRLGLPLIGTFPPGSPENSQTIQVDYARQIS